MVSLKDKNTHWPNGQSITRALAATTAIKSYLKGDLLTAATYIEQAAVFVQSNAAAKKETCPFQYDAVIVFNELEPEIESDSDDEDGDDKKDPDEMEDDSLRMSQMGNVQQRLDKSQLKCIALPMNPRKVRRTDEAYGKLQNALKKSNVTFPRHSRFCSIMDFRNDQQDGDPINNEPNFFVFEANEENRKVYPDASSLNYFNNGYTIIPPSDEDADDALGTLSTGPQIVLSFHVDDADSIRCYIFVYGQWSRFQAKDVKLLLPFFLEDSTRNQKFLESDQMNETIKSLEGIIKDKAFDSFLERNGVKCPLKE